MEGLTAKVFRTYNASKTLQDQLDSLTNRKSDVNEKLLAYNRANRQVAILCNHQRSVPKTFGKSMEALKAKVNRRRNWIFFKYTLDPFQIDAKKAEVNQNKTEVKRAKAEHKSSRSQASEK